MQAKLAKWVARPTTRASHYSKSSLHILISVRLPLQIAAVVSPVVAQNLWRRGGGRGGFRCVRQEQRLRASPVLCNGRSRDPGPRGRTLFWAAALRETTPHRALPACVPLRLTMDSARGPDPAGNRRLRLDIVGFMRVLAHIWLPGSPRGSEIGSESADNRRFSVESWPPRADIGFHSVSDVCQRTLLLCRLTWDSGPENGHPGPRDRLFIPGR